jgi:hypothetical protein
MTSEVACPVLNLSLTIPISLSTIINQSLNSLVLVLVLVRSSFVDVESTALESTHHSSYPDHFPFSNLDVKDKQLETTKF